MKTALSAVVLGRINGGPGDGYEFRPIDRDTFQLGMLTIRFRDTTSGR